MLKIGITGGIGSGKSTIAKIFETLGISVYNADEAAKRLMNTDESLKAAIKKEFGNETFMNGLLDQKLLASVVFNDPQKLEALNSLVHPATINDAAEWIKKQISPYIIKEAALLIEAGAEKMMDYVIGVFAPKELCIQRVMNRDSINREEVVKRMKRQMPEVEKLKQCDFIIVNDEQELLIPQVLALHQQFLLKNTA